MVKDYSPLFEEGIRYSLPKERKAKTNQLTFEVCLVESLKMINKKALRNGSLVLFCFYEGGYFIMWNWSSKCFF